MRGTVAPHNSTSRPAGLAWLIETYELPVPEPSVRSEIVDGSKGTFSQGMKVVRRYTRQYEPVDVRGHLRFALKYEPLDLRVYQASMPQIVQEVTRWVREQPTSAYARRAWYLAEALTGEKLPLDDASGGGWVWLADEDLQFVGSSRPSHRHKVAHNLLGDISYSPMVRKTPTLVDRLKVDFVREIEDLIKNVDPAVVARAGQYLYTRETKSSYAIERQAPSQNYVERFVALLETAGGFIPTEENLVRLQNAIVEPRYREPGYRTAQNYVGETRANHEEVVRYACPKPEDVPALMRGWRFARARMDNLDPIVAAAVIAFGFVLIHPFLDGNGRIHRFLIHSILANRNYTPEGMIFPVSSVMLRHKRQYEQVLDAHSESLLPYIDFEVVSPGNMVIHNTTTDLYRFPDLTPFAEYLFECIDETVRVDLVEELGFLTKFDQARTALRFIVDMPDARARLLLTYLFQNEGKLSANKRGQFTELTNDEIAAIESRIAMIL